MANLDSNSAAAEAEGAASRAEAGSEAETLAASAKTEEAAKSGDARVKQTKLSTNATEPLEEMEEQEEKKDSGSEAFAESTSAVRRPESRSNLLAKVAAAAAAAARAKRGAGTETPSTKSPGDDEAQPEDMEASEDEADVVGKDGTACSSANSPRGKVPTSKRRPEKLRLRDLSPKDNERNVGGCSDEEYDRDPHDLYERFVRPQRIMLPSALREIRAGMKQSCWLWFVLPTAPYVVNGVERGSGMNRRYALRGDAAAIAYLRFERDGVRLRSNYYAVAKAVLDQLEGGSTMGLLFGPMDEPKAVSSFRLFERIAGEMGDEELRSVCGDVLRLAETALGGGKKLRGGFWRKKQRSY